MSISLSVVKKDNTYFKISDFVKEYLEALEASYTNSEMESFVYGENGGVFGVVFENSTLPEENTEDLYIKRFSIASRDIVIIKMLHKNNSESRQQLLERVEAYGDLQSPFVLMEHVVLLSAALDEHPPCNTYKGKIYLDVGRITKYFLYDKQLQRGTESSRGEKFAKAHPEMSNPELINAYFSKFLDSGKYEELTATKHTGLAHFTTVLAEEDAMLVVYFLQNKQRLNTARYFFEPDCVFSSSEAILRHFRHNLYPSSDTPIKSKLKMTSIHIP